MSTEPDWVDDPNLDQAATRARFDALSGINPDDDFFETDQPLTELLAAFETGQRGITWPPVKTGRPAASSGGER